MSAQANAPVIIKRKKNVVEGGHHGGAWKVAYADFVTAMMAFFLLMWLLNATTEQQRKGIADYFAPAVPISRVSGGGDGMFGGDSVFARDTLVRDGEGATSGDMARLVLGEGAEGQGLSDAGAAELAALEEAQAALLGRGGESLVSELALRHVVTRLTDEGLVIEVFAREGAPIFEGDGSQPTAVTLELLAMIARIAGQTVNPVAVSVHLPARPLILAENPVWTISTERADRVRRELEGGGLDPARIRRLTGLGDRNPSVPNPLDVRNDRIEIVLLRTQQGRQAATMGR